MSNIIKNSLIAGSLMAVALTSVANAGTLENLERERALTIETMLDPGITPDVRQKKISSSTHRLVDLERMVIRDPALKGSTKPVVRVAFENYDLTFMAHASIENQVGMMDQWLDQIGITTASLMDSRMGRR